jgi:hypothetical protein
MTLSTKRKLFRKSIYSSGRYCNTQRRQDRGGKKLRWNDSGKKVAVGYPSSGGGGGGGGSSSSSSNERERKGGKRV